MENRGTRVKKMTGKKYKAVVRIGTDDNGNPINKYVSANSQKELENTKAAIREHYLYGEPLPKEKLFFEYAESWYRLRKEPFVSTSVKASYKSCFMKHILPEFGLQNLKAISAGQIQEFVNGFSNTSKSQITLVMGILKAVFSSAYADGLIERDPTVALIRPKSQKQQDRRPLTKAETKRILHTIKTHPEGLLLAVLYYLGLRRGEALGLKWGDFDWKEDQVHIQRDIDFTYSTAREGALKTEAADRFVPVPEKLKKMLLEKKGEAGEYLFHDTQGNPLSQASFKRMWCWLMADAKCAVKRDYDPHDPTKWDILKQIKPTLTPHFFRYNFVTLLYEAGVDPLNAMKIVGHTDYKTTANIYTHVRDEMLRKATVNLEEVFESRGK